MAARRVRDDRRAQVPVMPAIMRIFDMLRHFAQSVVGRRQADIDLDDELRSYMELAVAERVRMGQDAASARRAVMLSMGGVENVKELVRDTRRTQVLESLVRDARFALLSFRRTPGFTVVAILTLALGIGGATAVFSVVDAVLLRPIGGVRSPERLVSLGRVQDGGDFDSFGFPDFAFLRSRLTSVAGLAAHIGVPLTMTTAGESPVRLRGQLVTGDYFRLLGVQTAAGRLIGPGDDAAPAARAVVISHDYWKRMGAPPDAIGHPLELNGYQFVVVGIAAEKFNGTAIGDRTDVWAPLAAQPQLLSRMSQGIMQSRSAGWLQVFGRLTDGASIERVAAEVHTVARQLAGEYPATNSGRDIAVRNGIGLGPAERADLARMFWLLSSGVGLVLLIACFNVGGLMLVRARSRRREMAARLALGASRGQLIRQLAVEALLLTTAGGVLALTFASALAGAATWLQPSGSVLRGVTVGVDWRMMAIAAAVTLASAGLLTLVPAFRVSRLDPITALKATSPGSGGGGNRGQQILVGAQVALSFALLVTGTVVTAAMLRLLARPTGFDASSVVMVSVDLSAKGYAADRGLPFLEKVGRAHRQRTRVFVGIIREDSSTARLERPRLLVSAGHRAAARGAGAARGIARVPSTSGWDRAGILRDAPNTTARGSRVFRSRRRARSRRRRRQPVVGAPPVAQPEPDQPADFLAVAQRSAARAGHRRWRCRRPSVHLTDGARRSTALLPSAAVLRRTHDHCRACERRQFQCAALARARRPRRRSKRPDEWRDDDGRSHGGVGVAAANAGDMAWGIWRTGSGDVPHRHVRHRVAIRLATEQRAQLANRARRVATQADRHRRR